MSFHLMLKSATLRTLTMACAAAAFATPASAETLDEAVAAAMQTNPTLLAQRARLDATREQLPQARAEGLPFVTATANANSAQNELVSGRDESWSANLSASQLLFAGGRVAASVRQARANIAGAIANYTDAEQQLILDVADAYAAVRQGQAILAARETSVSNLTEQYRFAQAQFDAGLVTRTDVAQSAAQLAQARTQLVQARGLVAAAVEAYMRLVGHPPAELSPPRTAQGMPSSLEQALELGGRENPVLLSAHAAAQSADAAVDIANSNFFPNVSLTAGLGEAGRFDGAGDSISSDSVGVRMGWDLFTGGLNRSRSRQQRALRSAANHEVAAAQRIVREQVTTAWTSLQSAQAAVVSAREQVEAAELAYTGIRLEQETGLRSTIDVLIQEQQLLDARLAVAQAERDLVVAERNLLASVGALARSYDQAAAREQ
jgi:outer membrane protein